MKALKIILSVLALFAFVLVLACSVLYLFVDPDRLKPVIVAEVKNRTGYALTIDGRLSWTWYPWLAVRVPHMQLKQPGEKAVLADMTNVRVAADLKSLFHDRQRIFGNILIDRLVLMNLNASQVSAKLTWQNDVLTINPLHAELYQGTLTGQMAGRHFTSTPAWQWDVTLNKVQLKPLLTDLDAKNKLLVTGVARVTMQGSTEGESRREMISSLNGNLTFNVNNGTVDAINLNYLIRAADALINKQPVPVPANISQTAFDSLSGQVKITNGTADFSAIHLVSSAFQTAGQGTIHLSSNQIDMRIRTVPQEDVKTHWEVPVKITGSLERPDIRLDTDQVTKDTLKQQIEKVKDKARDLIQKHMKGDTSAYLQKLLSR